MTSLTPDQEALVCDFTDWAIAYVDRRFRPYESARQDLHQQAMIGLVYAARRFDPRMGVHFSVYAKRWVFKFVQEYMKRDRTIVPPHKEARQGEPYKYTFSPVDKVGDEATPDRMLTYVEPGYEGVEDEAELAWVRSIMARYGPEVVEYFHTHGVDDTRLGQSAKLMADEIREGYAQ